MATESTRGGNKAKKETSSEVLFKCRLCQKDKPISEMKIVTRFRPVVVVCQDCEKDVR